MSIKSRISIRSKDLHIKGYQTQSQPISSLNSISLNSSSTNTYTLIERLLKLEVDLVSRINELKKDKISALESYNHQFDRYSLLSLEFSRMNPSNSSHHHRSQHSSDITNPQINQDDCLAEQTEYKKILLQLYQLRDKNNLDEGSLTLEQLQQLNYLLKSCNSTHKQLSIQKAFSNREDEVFLRQLQRNRLQNNASEESAWIEQINVIREVTQKLLSKKLSYLKCQQKLISSSQSESITRVNELLQKRTFLQKQLYSINQSLVSLETHSIQTNIKSINNIQQKKSPILKKWQNIQRYKQLHQTISQLIKFPQQSHLQPSDRNSHSPQYLGLQIHPISPEISYKITSQSRLNVLQQLKEKNLNQQQHEANYTIQVKENQTLKQIQQKIQRYEEHIREQNANKHELYNQISAKNLQFDQLKRQNQLMFQILKSTHL